jgi:hypothetical protein
MRCQRLANGRDLSSKSGLTDILAGLRCDIQSTADNAADRSHTRIERNGDRAEDGLIGRLGNRGLTRLVIVEPARVTQLLLAFVGQTQWLVAPCVTEALAEMRQHAPNAHVVAAEDIILYRRRPEFAPLPIGLHGWRE